MMIKFVYIFLFGLSFTTSKITNTVYEYHEIINDYKLQWISECLQDYYCISGKYVKIKFNVGLNHNTTQLTLDTNDSNNINIPIIEDFYEYSDILYDSCATKIVKALMSYFNTHSFNMFSIHKTNYKNTTDIFTSLY